MLESRLMLVHALAPPTPGGTPVVLRRLLTNLPGVRIEVVTNRKLRRQVRAGGDHVLDAPYHFVWKWPGWGGRFRAGRVVIAAIDLMLSGVAGIRIAGWARRDKVDWVMSVTDEGFSVIAGAIAAKLARIPHVVMVFDLWEENAYNGPQRAIARRLEGPILRSAAKVVGYCDEVVEYYRAKHGIAPSAIRTPVELDGPPPAEALHASSSRELLLAGAIYWVQLDSVARLLSLRGRVAGLTIVGIGNERMLRAHGLSADRHEPELANADFQRRLAKADVLFIGLSFNSDHPEIVRTGTPARFVDAMASGRPLLIHAPRGSHVADYARREDLAEVVDIPDREALLAGLQTVLNDVSLSQERAARARRVVEQLHDAQVVRASFVRLLREVASSGS
jgi:glycosyltransferase involved in cell wall biosynthesis